MKKLDVMLVAVIALGVAAFLKEGLARDFSLYLSFSVASMVVVCERYAAAWWGELLRSREEGRLVDSNEIVSAVRTHTTMLALYVPLERAPHLRAADSNMALRQLVRVSFVGYLPGALILFISIPLFMIFGPDDYSGGRLYAGLLKTDVGKLFLFAVFSFFACWSLSYYLFSKAYFIGRKSCL